MALCLVSNTPDDWHSILRYGILNLKGKSFRASICKVAVYHVWIQRNNRNFDEEIKTKEQIVKAIRRDVKARMEG
jgi:hypothetical protein